MSRASLCHRQVMDQMSLDEVCEYELIAGDRAYTDWLSAGKPVKHLATSVATASNEKPSSSGVQELTQI